MRIAIAALSFALALPAAAQITWHNVRFGETREQVRSELAAQGFPVEISQEGSLQSISDYNILLPGMRNTLPLRADFHFTDAGTLMDVTLSLDLPAMRRSYPSLGGDEALLAFAYERFNRALSDKYAAPLFVRSECSADGATLAKLPSPMCTVNFRGEGQSVELTWLQRPYRLFIRYQMLASDL